jgi:hypothetical protein
MHGCSRQDHILYGFCLDGKCGKRTKIENAFLQTKNHIRMGAESAELCQAAVVSEFTPPKRKTRSNKVTMETHGTMAQLVEDYSSPEKQSMLKREWIESQVPDPKITMHPLHLAARRGDVMAIRKMAVLNFDINFIEGDRQETPLQLATRSQHLDAVNAILDEFHTIVDVNMQNTNGDTALHIATRKGWTDFVDALCGADADPLIKNHNGQTPLKEAHLFSVQQLLRMQEEVFTLRRDLEEAQKAVRDREQAEEDRLRGLLTLDKYMAAEDNNAASKALSIAGGGGGGGGGPGGGSRSQSRPRSRLIEMNEDKFDPAVDASKTNKSLFRIVRKTTNLKDPKKNSFVLGYWPDDDGDAEEKKGNKH